MAGESKELSVEGACTKGTNWTLFRGMVLEGITLRKDEEARLNSRRCAWGIANSKGRRARG